MSPMSPLQRLAAMVAGAMIALPGPWSAARGLASPAEPDPMAVAEFVAGYAEENMEDAGVPGMVFVHVDGSDVVTTTAHGMADLAADRPMTVDTPLRVGSISKPVTAALAFELAAAGTVDLDVPADHYLDVDLGDDHGPASTIRQLLYHRGGYPDAIVASHHPDGGVEPLADWVATVPARPLAPGTVPSYSSVGYSIAGTALAGAMGLDFDELARVHLFEPLAMSTATFTQPPPPTVAVGYEGGPGSLAPLPLDEAQLVPGAGLTATARDVGRFLAALLGPDGLHPTTRAAMVTVSADEPEQRGLTAGMAEWRYDQRSVLYHEGNGIGTSNRIMVLPTEGIGFYTAVNGASLTGMGEPSSQTRFLRDLHAELIDRFYPRSDGDLVRAAVPGITHGRPADDIDGAYVPTRADTTSILRLEALVTHRGVRSTADGIELDGTAYLAVPGSPGVFRDGDRTVVFVEGSDGITYATTGGTGSYRKAAAWESLAVNIVVVGGSVAAAVAVLALVLAGLGRGCRSFRWATSSTALSILAFVALLGSGIATVETMDLFTGLTLPIRLAQVAAAATVASTAMLAVTVAVSIHRRQVGWRASSAAVATTVAGAAMSAWAWYWQVLPV